MPPLTGHRLATAVDLAAIRPRERAHRLGHAHATRAHVLLLIPLVALSWPLQAQAASNPGATAMGTTAAPVPQLTLAMLLDSVGARHPLVAAARARVRAAEVVASMLVVGACATGALFGSRPTPAALVGRWVDSSTATPTDTVVWILAANGADQTMVVHVPRDADGVPRVERHTSTYGAWYQRGAMADTAGRAICFDPKGRNFGSCYAFRLDTVRAAGAEAARRRLVIVQYRGAHYTRDRILVERTP